MTVGNDQTLTSKHSDEMLLLSGSRGRWHIWHLEETLKDPQIAGNTCALSLAFNHCPSADVQTVLQRVLELTSAAGI